MSHLSSSIIQVLQYFSQYSYPPTISEIYTFLNRKTSSHEFKLELTSLLKKKQIIQQQDRISVHKSFFGIYTSRSQNSISLIKNALPYVNKLKLIPTIRYIGISGSLSMLNTSEEGDIDLFIITTMHSIWITRFLVLMYKYSIKLLDKDIGTNLCFNLFFAENELKIEKIKQNEYTGHEILQLKPIYNKNITYELFLQQNRWLIKLFPNIQIPQKKKMSKNMTGFNFLLYYLDRLIKIPQIWWLKRNNLRWKETKGQLWLIQ
ncbi:MAG TPA: hypothetical protein PLS49_08560 [Candidatus Woesebacteria bacterium]|nr:hypothetical protein [Candidatus Woesebacteria bacterium]